MRIAALILVLMLVVAIATEVDGILGGRRRRRRRRRRRPVPPIPTLPPCDSCFCCMIGGKRSVDLDGNIYPNDASLEKRDLTYPGDCISETMRSFAQNCGFCVTHGGSDYKVCSGGELVTTIPHFVEADETCRNIIDTLNARPECQDA